MKKFSIGDAVGFGWNTVKKQPIIILYVFIASFGAQLVNYLAGMIFGEESVINMILSITTGLFSIVLSIGLTRVLLTAYEGKPLSFPLLYSDYRKFFPYIGASIISGFAALLGFLLLIVPGIIIGIKMSLWPYFMIDKGMGPMQSVKASWEATKGQTGNLFVFYLVQGLVALLGLILIVVGLLVAIPVISLATVYVYKKLIGDSVVNPVPAKPQPAATAPVQQ